MEGFLEGARGSGFRGPLTLQDVQVQDRLVV